MMLGRELTAMYPPKAEQLDQVRLEVRNLRVGGIRGEVDIAVRRGEILGVTGQIGSGADEFMKSLAGILPVASGEVLLDGTLFVEPLQGHPQGPLDCIRMRLGKVFEGINVPDITMELFGFPILDHQERSAAIGAGIGDGLGDGAGDEEQ